MVLQAKLHAGIAKGRDSLRHVDGPADNFEALRAGVCGGVSVCELVGGWEGGFYVSTARAQLHV